MTAQLDAGTAATDGVALDDLLRRTDDDLRAGRVGSPPLPLGFPVLDDHIGLGLQPADLAVLAGAQGVGKTTVALQMARNVAAAGAPVTFVCFEHGVDQLLERLLVLEANLAVGDSAPRIADVREATHRVEHASLSDRVAHLAGMGEALDRIEQYGRWLHLVSARGDATGVAELRAATAWHDRPGLVVVDYLQKLPFDPDRGEVDLETSVARTATALKDFAMETQNAVLAISALDRQGLAAKRIRARHLQGSVTLAYEADLIFVLQHKYDVVARDLIMYDPVKARDLHQWLVLSLEKNRHGEEGIDLAFRQRLSRAHLDPRGHVEVDPLLDERVHLDDR